VLSTDIVDQGRASEISHVVGREHELAAIREFIDGPALVPALVLTGPPGIGKTTLWEATVARARASGWNVLVSRASEAEVALSFAGLTDLLDGVEPALLAELASPQQQALEVALARAEPSGAPPEQLAIAAGLLALLRLPEMGERVLVAVDDAQWLDRASAAALAFAARRALGERVRVLLAIRAGHTSPVEREIASRRLDLGALTLLDARRLVSLTLGLSVPRPLMARLMEAAHGNPLVVLELGRLLVERGTLELGSGLPLPELTDELFGARVRALPANVHRALLATALSAQLTRTELAALCGPTAIAETTAHGVLAIEGDRARAAHPLLAAAAVEHATAEEREAIHLELAGVLADPPRAARHLALATAEPDRARAATVAEAATTARRRGASRDAAELADHALRLTPPDDPDRIVRLLTLGEYLLSAGEVERLRQLLEPEIESLPAGPVRGRAHLLLADLADSNEHMTHLELAIAHSHGQPELLAAALASKVMLFAVLRVEQVKNAEQWALEGCEAAHTAGPAHERRALCALAWTRVLRGHEIDDLVKRSRIAEDGASLYEVSIERVAAVRHAFRGEVEQAREAFEQLLELADERGEAISGEIMLLHLCELALRAGDCNRARQVLETWEDWAALDEMIPGRTRCYALLAAEAGEHDQALARAEAAFEISEDGWDHLESTRALGLAALLGSEPGEAAEHFGAVWEHIQRAGVEELGAFPVANDLVQVLTELGRSDEAAAVTRRLRESAEAQQHPWGLASAGRCEAIIALAAAWSDEAERALSESADAYARLGLWFDRARTLLALGRAQRRYRKWGAARDTLELAGSAFEQLGAAGWAELARSELERVGARRPAGEGNLTSAESRVVALAAEGRSNKEIALALVITVHTVEVHLSHAYAKLGVRSRTQLAGALAALQSA
jgi:DNA-binding NarL/FixJ family response regulator